MVIRKRLDLQGPAAAFITATLHNFVRLFEDESRANQMTEQIGETSSHYRASILAWIVMPSHIHLLLGFPAIERMSDFVRDLKQLSARRISPVLDASTRNDFGLPPSGSIWQPRFDDLIVTSDRQLRVKMNYIHENPVRVGLVSLPTDYRFSSAVDWMSGHAGLLPVDKNWEWLDREE